jgi:PAS domain S-box-containing protein
LGPTGAIIHLSSGHRHPIAQIEHRRGLRTLMHVPVLRGDGTVIAIASVGTTRPAGYAARDLARLAELSRTVGAVAERAELLEAARRRTEQAASLSRLMNDMPALAEPRDVALAFARELQRSFSARLVAVVGFDPDSGRHALLAAVPDRAGDHPFDAVALGQGFQWMQLHANACYDASVPDRGAPWLARPSRLLGLSSSIAVRMEANGAPLGMIVVAAREPGWLGAAELEELTGVASPLAILLERAHLVTSLGESTRRTSSILGLLEAFGPGASLDELANPLATALRNLFHADAAAVMLRDSRGLRIAAIDSDDPSLRGVRARRELRGEQPWPAKRRVLRNLQAAAEPLDPLARLMRDRGYGACTTITVGPSSPIQCAVTLASRSPGAFTERDGRQLAQTLRPVEVAVAYHAGKRETAERERRLETTNRILGRFARGGAPAELATAFAQECVELFGCSAAVVYRQDPGSDHATVLGSCAALGGRNGARIVSLGNLRELDVYDSGVGTRSEALARRGIGVTLRVPLAIRDVVWGAVELLAERPGHFSADDRNLLEALAGPLAMGLEKATTLEALAESELKYRSVVAQAEEMILLLDVQSRRILDANPYATRALGYLPGALLGLRDDDISGPAMSGFVAKSVEEMRDDVELRLSDQPFRRLDGSLLELDVVATMVSFGGRRALLVMARDMAERKAMQRQLMQAQKMESLGQLAGAVAHDFNNLLTTILGFAGILKIGGQLDDENRDSVGLIEDAARRGADLTSRLLSFSRGGLVRYGPVDVRVVIADTLRLAGPTLGLRFQVETVMPESPIVVDGDEGQLQQAMLNIILNARDAMPHGGVIAIRLEASDGHAVLSIADNGPGMDEEVRLRVFEPFYTTKPAGSGTGLGLAITYGIVQGHHGRIDIASTLGEGSRFTISLPLAGSPPSGAGTRTMLIVDDDELVRRASSRLVGKLGFSAQEAAGGADAIDLLQAAPQRYAGVILDLVMPGLSGRETLEMIRQIRADIPVVICSAFAAESHLGKAGREGYVGLLPKPFTPERLAAALEEAGIRIAAPAGVLA